MSNLFCVTANGPAATRWLSFVIASNPAVFVAHGSYPLNSVVDGSFQEEKEMLQLPINSDAVTRGRLAEKQVKRTPLKELYSLYKEDFPKYKTHGNVHSFVLHELHAKEGLRELNLNIYNLIRHPINYIASHTQLVMDADSYAPELRLHYELFFTKQFMKDFSNFNTDFSEFDIGDTHLLGHLLSCYTIKRQQVDLNLYKGEIKNLRMEDLVSNSLILKDTCEKITGQLYDEDEVAKFISYGSLNQHRKSKRQSTENIYNNWSQQKKDIFNYILSPEDLSIYKENDYDLSFLSQ